MLLNSDSAERLAAKLKDLSPFDQRTMKQLGYALTMLGSLAKVEALQVEDGELHANLTDFAEEAEVIGVLLTMIKGS